jgi:hypothetical protein
MFELNRKGCTRLVVLTRRFAFKVPNPSEWRLFLHGLIANMQERQFSKAGWPELCPVKFALPLGFLVVMDRAQPMTREQWDAFDAEAFCTKDDYCIPAELKMDSFGWLRGRAVAVDYG